MRRLVAVIFFVVGLVGIEVSAQTYCDLRPQECAQARVGDRLSQSRYGDHGFYGGGYDQSFIGGRYGEQTPYNWPAFGKQGMVRESGFVGNQALSTLTGYWLAKDQLKFQREGLKDNRERWEIDRGADSTGTPTPEKFKATFYNPNDYPIVVYDSEREIARLRKNSSKEIVLSQGEHRFSAQGSILTKTNDGVMIKIKELEPQMKDQGWEFVEVK